MNAIPRYLAFVALLAVAAVAAGQSVEQGQPLTPTQEAQLRRLIASSERDRASHELRVDDIRAQQPQEKLASNPGCQQALNSPQHLVIQRPRIDASTFARSLAALMEQSDEVVLAGIAFRYQTAFSPSGESAVGYFDVKVFRSWKGPHEVGDTLTFAVPAASVNCGSTEDGGHASFTTLVGFRSPALRGALLWKRNIYFGPYILFLRHPPGKETELVQTLLPAGGGGLQGMFPIKQNPTSEEARHCNGQGIGLMEWCDSFLETSTQNTVEVPYVADPLAKKYDGMPIADFLQEVHNTAADQGLDEKRP
jgi:hypothetical protein